MKKTVVILFLLASVAGFGQKGLNLGLGGFGGSSGVVNQNVYGYPELDYDFPFSYGFNLNVGYGFTDHLGVVMQIGYAQLGQKYSDTRGDTSFTRDFSMSYLTIPVMFRYLSGGKAVRFYVAAGPELAFLLSAKQEYMYQTPNMTEPAQYNKFAVNKDGEAFNVGEPDIKDRVTPIDYMVRIDFGVNISLAENLFMDAGLTMNYGLSDLNASAYRMEDYSGNYNPSHNFYGGITVGLSYRLPLGK
jgi:hypothetical protein